MSKKGDIYLGTFGSEFLLSAFGRKLSVQEEQMTREGRTVNGRLVRDVIATKKTISLKYDLIGGNELATVLSIYSLNSELSLQIYHTDDEGGTTSEPEVNYDQYTVLMDSVNRTRELLASDGLWSDVSINLKEV